MEAVVAARRVVKEERRRTVLPVRGAAREVGVEVRRIPLGLSKRRHPAVGNGREARVERPAQRRHRLG